MTVFIAGATGATGRQAVTQLLMQGVRVRAIVRSKEKLMNLIGENSLLTVIEDEIATVSESKLTEYMEGCDAVISCLGHNLNFKGIYGDPRRLVADAAAKMCRAVAARTPGRKVKFILMNTTGNRNRNLTERRSIGEAAVIGLLRLLLPPQADNEDAAEYLRSEVGSDNQQIEWVAVRPDTLINEDTVSGYKLYPSPVRSPVFNAGRTSRINIGHFMTELLIDDKLWDEWKGQMPVIYNEEC